MHSLYIECIPTGSGAGEYIDNLRNAAIGADDVMGIRLVQGVITRGIYK